MASRKSVNSNATNATRRSVLDMEIELQEAEVKLAKLKIERAKASISSTSSDTSSVMEFETCRAVKDWIEANDYLVEKPEYVSDTNLGLGRSSDVKFVGLGRPSAAQISEQSELTTKCVVESGFGRPSVTRFAGLGRPSAARIGVQSEQTADRMGESGLGRPNDVQLVSLGRPSAAQLREQSELTTERVGECGLGRPSDVQLASLGRPSATRISEHREKTTDFVFDSGFGRPSDRLGQLIDSEYDKLSKPVLKTTNVCNPGRPGNQQFVKNCDREKTYENFYRTPTNDLKNSTQVNNGSGRDGEIKPRVNIETDILRDAFVSVLKEVTDRNDETSQVQKLIARQTIGGELTNFDGSPKDWLAFATRFKRTTQQCCYNDEENMSRLRKCLKGRAYETVRMILENSCNVTAAMEILEVNFGRPDMIIGDLIEEAKRAPTLQGWGDFVQFANIVLNLEATISNLNETVYVMNPLLLREFVAKLPPYIELKWADFLMDRKIRSPTLKHFSECVKISTATITHAGLVHHGSQFSTTPQKSHSQFVGKSPNQNTHSNTRSCKVCRGAHAVDVCENFQQMSVKQRWREAERNRLCYGCLGNHSKNNCNNLRVCGMNQCPKNHHRLLHQDVTPSQPQTQNQQQQSLVHVSEQATLGQSVLLRIVPVVLKGPKAEFSTFALLDDASTITMVDAAVADKIGVDGPASTLCCVWTKKKVQTEDDSKKVTIGIRNTYGEKIFDMKNVRTIKDLALPELGLNAEELQAAYPFVGGKTWQAVAKAKPTILIGQDNANLTVTRCVIQPDPQGVILSKCHLGWTVHGPINTKSKPNQAEIVNFCCEKAADDLHQEVKDFFRIENFGVALITEEKQRSTEDQKVIRMAEQTLHKVGDRYEIGLPWKDDDPILPDSRSMAMQRLQCLERQLNRDCELKKQYCAKIQELFEKKYARVADPDKLKTAKNVWYLPHFAVTNPNKPGKVRVVFDAAAKFQGVCLNDRLSAGPDWLTSLFGALCRFRIHPVAFTADIQEMFNQVHIRDDDTYAQCFVWRNMNTNVQPTVYQMKAMLFGTKSSPFLAQYVKNKNAEEHREEFPEAAKAIIENHYVDDYLGGADNVASADKLIREVIHVHNKGGFHLTKFASNSKELLAQIPAEFKSTAKVTNIDNQERVLGIGWNNEVDCFTFQLGFHKVDKRVTNGEKVPTKRDVLKTAMSLYDPLGFLVPVTIKSKIFLQHIWRSGIGWDDEINSEMFEQWKQWLQELKQIEKIQIPRCYSMKLKEAKSLQLHTFCDASEDAYSAVVFLRIEFEKNYEVAFVAAKGRVAPLKSLTIPKMELMAAVAGSRLAHTVRQQIDLNISREVFWSDSRTVLCWIKSEKRLQSFVASRVGEINELTETKSWRWIPTKLNVADDATRNKPQHDFGEDSRWLKGPKFLYLNENEWPTDTDHAKEQNIEEGIIQEEWVAIVAEVESPLPDIKRFSSWSRLIRATAWCNRFIRNSRETPENRTRGGLTVEEIEKAERQWWREVQTECFGNDRRSTKSGEKFSYRLNKLSPTLDEEGVLRIAGRIERAEIVDIATRNPVILDGRHRYVELMIKHLHQKANHQGVETVINQLRERFWIIKCRSAVKRQFQNCLHCKRRKAKPAQPIMGQLPTERFASHEKPFTNTGVDFFGPFYVTVGRRTEKRYGVLFTCLTIRAIHLEVAHDLSTNSCVMAIRRMVSRRGAVKKMFSDNGTNLRGAERELREAIQQLDNNAFKDELVKDLIDWHFIPPASPHMGGAWERMVGAVKRALVSVMTGQRLNDEMLLTVFAEAEHIINSRPLTRVSDDHSDPLSLTPNHFLIGATEANLPPGGFGIDDNNWRRRWRTVQFLTDQFWKRWLKEYVPLLVTRSKWHKRESNLAEGDLVVVEDSNLPRNLWPIGVVKSVLPGGDGVVRTVDVRMARGVLRRPAVKVCPYVRVGEEEPTPGGGCCDVNNPSDDEEEFYGF